MLFFCYLYGNSFYFNLWSFVFAIAFVYVFTYSEDLSSQKSSPIGYIQIIWMNTSYGSSFSSTFYREHPEPFCRSTTLWLDNCVSNCVFMRVFSATIKTCYSFVSIQWRHLNNNGKNLRKSGWFRMSQNFR